jgi:S1-C subfamily serine protease
MSKKWLPLASALTATGVAAVLLVATPGGTVGVAHAATATGTTHTSSTAKSASTATRTAATPTAPSAPSLSAKAAKKLAESAANRVSSAIVDVDASNSTTGAAGTGIVLTATGEVLTNNHVVAGFDRITATDIATGKTYTAKVVGTDPADDIAVLALVDASGLPVASLASSALSVGSAVVAVGNANGTGGAPKWALGSVTVLGASVTATNEEGKSPESLTGMLKTTTPIVPGYSGGPLVNSAGQVVGMDTSGQFSSLSKPATAAYAIPIAAALAVANQLVAAAQ